MALTHDVQGDSGDATVRSGQQVDDEGVLDQPDVVGPLHRGDQRPLDLRAGRVSAGVRDAVAVMPALPRQRQVPIGQGVEPRAQLDQVSHRVRSLGHQRPYGVRIAQSGARDQGVLQMILGRILRAERGGDTALGPLGRAGGDDILGHHQDSAELTGFQCGGQSGDAGTDHHHVDGVCPTGFGRRQPLRDSRSGHPATVSIDFT